MADVTPSKRVTTPAPQAVVPQTVAVKAEPGPVVEHVPLGQQIGNFGTGIRNLGRAERAWELATEYDKNIAAFEEVGDHARAVLTKKEQLAESERRKAKKKTIRDRVLKWCWPVLACGWPPFTMVFILLAVGAVWLAAKWKVLAPSKAQHAVLMALVSVGLTAVNVLAVVTWGDTSARSLAWASRWYLLLPGLEVGILLVAVLALLAWVWHATRLDATAQDDITAVMAPAGPEEEKITDEAIVQAVTASPARLPKDTRLIVLPPGVGWLAGRKLWTATLDTGGPDAGPIVAARKDIASRLGLSDSRFLPQQSAKYGRHVTFTGIVQSPWGDPIPSPLLDMERFRFGDPIPYAVDMLGQPWMMPMFEMHYLIGGMPRKGKSTSCYPLYAAAGLDPLAPIWGIDGGTVDTKVWDDAGLFRMWTTKPEDAVAVLDDVLAEIEMRQDLLAQAQLVRPNAEFYARHGMSDGLLGFDEFASFTNHSDRKLAAQITRKLVSILQRAPKTNIHVVLSTQSPSAKAFDTDGRGVVEGRGALLCDSPEMSDKIMGGRSASRGIDASTLDETVKGLMWMSVPGDTRIIRPYLIDAEKGQARAIAQRAADLRARPAADAPGAAEVPELVLAVLRLLHQHEVASMRTAEIVGRLRAAGHDLPDGISGQQKLAAEMRRVKVSSVEMRPDRNRSHYLTADVEVAVGGSSVVADGKPGLRLVKGSR